MNGRQDLFRELVNTEKALRAEQYSTQAIADKRQVDAGNSHAEIAENLLGEFLKIQPFIAQDSAQHYLTLEGNGATQNGVSVQLSPKDIEALKGVFSKFVSQSYDSEGKINQADTEAHARNLGQLYKGILKSTQLPDPQWAAGTLLRLLASSVKWKEAAPHGISASRITNLSTTLEDRLEQALSGKTPELESTKFIQPPSSVETIEGLRFPYIKVQFFAGDMERTHLIRQDGGLVDLTNELRAELTQWIKDGKDIRDFEMPDAVLHLKQYIDPDRYHDPKERQTASAVRDAVGKLGAKPDIDGKPKRNRLPPVCMDIDLLTGLRMDGKNSELSQVMEAMKAAGFADFTKLLPEWEGNLALMPPDQREQAQQTIRSQVRECWEDIKEKARQDNPSVLSLLNKAEADVLRMLPRVALFVDEALCLYDEQGHAVSPILTAAERAKMPKDEAQFGMSKTQPDLYATQGGMASGKSGLEQVARRECGQHLVVASLDGVRGKADEYNLYIGSENHGDDYKKFEQFGKTVRSLTIEKARDKGLDVFIDATGVPFKGNYDNIFTEFGGKGYRRTLLAAAAPLYSENQEERKRLFELGLTPSDSLGRGGSRLKAHRRAVLPELMVKSHIGFAAATCDGARSPLVDRFLMEDYGGKHKEEFALSYTIDGITPDTLRELLHKRDNDLQDILSKNKLIPKYIKHPKEDVPRAVDFKVVHYDKENKKYRIEVITDMHSYLTNRQKGLYNHNARGPQELLAHRLDCDLGGHFHNENGTLRLQPQRAVESIPWPHFKQLASTLPSSNGRD